MDPRIQGLLEEVVYRRDFPPREEIRLIKNTLNARGFAESSTTMEMIGQKYAEEVEGLVREFTENVLRNADSLGLSSAGQIQEVMTQASNHVIAQARAALNEDVGEFEPNFQNMARTHFDDGIPDLQEQLNRTLALRDLALQTSTATGQGPGGHVGNLVVGPVNQPQLHASVQTLIQQGGREGKFGTAVHGLLETLHALEPSQSPEQAELLDLTKGLVQQMALPIGERSQGTVRVIWDRILELAPASAEVSQAVRKITPMLPALFSRG